MNLRDLNLSPTDYDKILYLLKLFKAQRCTVEDIKK